MRRVSFYFAIGAAALLVAMAFGPSFQASADSPTPGDWTNVAAGGTASASGSKSGYEPAKAIDLDSATYWKASKTTGWLAVKFSGAFAISQIHVHLATNVYASVELYLDKNNDNAYATSELVWSTSSNMLLNVKATITATTAYGAKVNFPVAAGSNKYPQVSDFGVYTQADTDRDGLPNDTEASTVYYYRTWASGMGVPMTDSGTSTYPLTMNALAGVPFRGLAEIVIDHNVKTDLSVSIGYWNGAAWVDYPVWDPGGRLTRPTLTAPTSGQWVGGTAVPVSASVLSTSLVKRMEYYIDSETTPKGTVTTPSGSVFTWYWDTSSYVQGSHTVKARSVDIWDGYYETSVVVNVDRTTPTVTITAPASGAFVEGSSVTVSWTATDTGSGVATVDVHLDSGSWIGLPGTSTTYTFTNVAYGTHTAYVRATDRAGIQSPAASVGFTNGPDQTPPSVGISGPSFSCPYEAVDLTASASDNVGLRTVTWLGTSRSLYGATSWSQTDTVGGYESGSYSYTLSATDLQGNSNSVSKLVTWRASKWCALSTPGASLTDGAFPADLSTGAGTAAASSSPATTAVQTAAAVTLTNPIVVWGMGQWATDAGYASGSGTYGTRHTVVVNLTRPLSSMTSAERSGRIVPVGLSSSLLNSAQSWRLVVTDWAAGTQGYIVSFSLRFEEKTSATLADTDGDGGNDATEVNTWLTSPIARDTDFDGLADGYERTARNLTITVNGAPTTVSGYTTDATRGDHDSDGLWDGEEETAGVDGYTTFPTKTDTDGDTISDGQEVTVYGTSPLKSDTDGDGVTDVNEVTTRSMPMVVNGVSQTRSVKTDPLDVDTDKDGTTDGQEWNGVSLYGYQTDPTDADTDDDGMSDFGEAAGLNLEPTDPLRSDSEGDGVIDGLDLAPNKYWDFPWTTSYEPGLVRFTQRIQAYGVHGNAALVFQWSWLYGCVFQKDDVADSTRSSDESTTSVRNQMNKVLTDGGETNFTAISASFQGTSSWGTATYTYGACDLWAPKKYQIIYIYEDHLYDIDLVNTRTVTIRDDAGSPFYHATIDVPLNASRSQNILIQVKVRADADRGSIPATGATTLPAFMYYLNRGTDFYNVPPFYRNVAVGTPIDDHVYEFNLRVPVSVASPANLVTKNGVTRATLVVTPIWLTSSGSSIEKSALDATTLTVGSAIVKVKDKAERLVVRLSHDIDAIKGVIPSTISSYNTGYNTFGSYFVYVYRLGATFDTQAPSRADAIYFIGSSDVEIADFQDDVTWSPGWHLNLVDGFGNAIKTLKFFDKVFSFAREFLTAVHNPVRSFLGFSFEKMSYERLEIGAAKYFDNDFMKSQYSIWVTTQGTGKARIPNPDNVNARITMSVVEDRVTFGEIVDDPAKSRLLADVRYANLKAALTGAAIGATVAIYGSEAALAYRDGNYLKGSVYVAAGGVTVLSIVKQDVVLVDNLFAGGPIKNGVKVKLGTVLALVAGGILSGYDLYMASQTSDPIRKQAYYEDAAAQVADTIISVVPYGAAAMIGWTVGVVLGAYVLGPLLGIAPNQLAIKIVSSPGSTIVFLWTYYFTSDIPTDIAEDALRQLLNFLVDTAEFNNYRITPPNPTIVLFPP